MSERNPDPPSSSLIGRKEEHGEEPLARMDSQSDPTTSRTAPTVAPDADVFRAIEAHAAKYLAGRELFAVQEWLGWARDDFKATSVRLSSKQIRKGTGDVLRDIAYAQRFTDGIQDNYGGQLGLEIDFVDRALRVAAGEIRELRKRLGARQSPAVREAPVSGSVSTVNDGQDPVRSELPLPDAGGRIGSIQK